MASACDSVNQGDRIRVEVGGRVTSAQTGLPITGAAVQLLESRSTVLGSQVDFDVTDNEGNYRLVYITRRCGDLMNPISARQYRNALWVTAEADGYTASAVASDTLSCTHRSQERNFTLEPVQ